LQGVAVAEILEDGSEPERRYVPGHPDADASGYVAFPKINPVEDMVDLTASVRSFQANLAAIGAVKEMLNRSLDLLR
ncbi:MAG: flagellar basal body rod protein FlgC, partial [Gemmatimonadales bacterium]